MIFLCAGMVTQPWHDGDTRESGLVVVLFLVVGLVHKRGRGARRKGRGFDNPSGASATQSTPINPTADWELPSGKVRSVQARPHNRFVISYRRRPMMRKFQESVKALKADIEHANAL
jgi:hypothetical protein